MSVEENRRKSKISQVKRLEMEAIDGLFFDRAEEVPSWMGYVGDMRTPQGFLLNKRWLSGWFPVKFLNSFFRALGAVAFANNPLTGILIFLGMYIGNIEVAMGSLLAGFMAFLACKMLSVNNDAVCKGVPMFNSILVGAISAAVAPSVFNTPLSLTIWCGIGFAAIVTVFVDEGLNSLIPSHLTAQSIPFNFVVTVLMIIVRMNNHSQQSEGILFDEFSTVIPEEIVAEEMTNITQFLTVVNNTSDHVVDWDKLWHGVLLSTGQVYGVGSPTPSVFIWLGLVLCSPLLAILMACGAIIGSVFGALLVPGVLHEVYQGLWGYNSLLAAGGIVFFNVPSPLCVITAILNACIAVCVQIALLPMFTAIPMPVFSYPFNIAIMIILAISLRKDSPLILVTDLSFPEFHLYKCYKDLNHEESYPNIEDEFPVKEEKTREQEKFVTERSPLT